MSIDLKFGIYVLDTETTGLSEEHDIIELSMYRLNDDSQKTWLIKPFRTDNIEERAMQVNGHDIKKLNTYQEPNEVIIDIENWMCDDMFSNNDRILCAHNANFDLRKMQAMWQKANMMNMFPFGDRPKVIDTLQMQLLLDILNNEVSEYYNLGSLIKKHGIKNEKAHRADADTRMCKDLFVKLLDIFKSKFNA